MHDFLEKVSWHASKVASVASDKATEVVELTKLKAKQGEVKHVKSQSMTEIGQYCFKLYEDGKIEDEVIFGLCENIVKADAELAEIAEEIEKIKTTY